MLHNDTNRLLAYYKESLAEFGDHDARSVHWSSTENQNIRFMILSQIANLNGMSVLDVGCGLGDLYTFLKKQNMHVEYTGIDIVPDFINLARIQFPTRHFECKDIFTVSEKYDYVVASGAMSFKVTDNKKYYFSMIEKMYRIATKGLAFNMLNHGTHIDDQTYASYDPNEIADFCKTLSDNVQIVVDYLPQDFTIYLYKE
jgi:cyclopropane fatty-acyl-phospholipid synthase-like methyltransferase